MGKPSAAVLGSRGGRGPALRFWGQRGPRPPPAGPVLMLRRAGPGARLSPTPAPAPSPVRAGPGPGLRAGAAATHPEG